MLGQPGQYTTACLIATMFPGHSCIGDHTTDRSFDLQATWVSDVVGSFLDTLSMGICTARHCHTSGRLVQELAVCTVTMSHKL